MSHRLRAIYERAKHPTLSDAIVGLGILGLVARYVIASRSIGSNDMLGWMAFGEEIRRAGLGHAYDTDTMFNHPPLMGLLAGKLYALSSYTGMRFELLFKIFPILADAVSGLLIHDTWRRRGSPYAAFAFAAFCWNPVSLLVTGYHGNTDSLCACLSLLAAVLVEKELAFLAGLALAASINVKLIPVLLAPALLSRFRNVRQAGRFVIGTSLGVIPFVPVALFHWQGFATRVLGWRSYPGEWGLTEIGRQIGLNPPFFQGAYRFNMFWIEHGSLIVLGFPLLLGIANLWKPRFSAPAIGACAFAGFLVLAPGWGVQYTVYLVPILFATHVGSALVYATCTGAYLLFVYAGLWTGTTPWYSDFNMFYYGQPVGARHLGGIAWTVTAGVLVYLLKGYFINENLRRAH
jgi:hypothetical protein